jgi:hypothetical protein
MTWNRCLHGNENADALFSGRFELRPDSKLREMLENYALSSGRPGITGARWITFEWLTRAFEILVQARFDAQVEARRRQCFATRPAQPLGNSSLLSQANVGPTQNEVRQLLLTLITETFHCKHSDCVLLTQVQPYWES